MKKIIGCFLFLGIAGGAYAQTAAQKAWTIHNRVAGVPPAPGSPAFQEMIGKISTNPGKEGLEEAALVAMSNRYFYDITLKNWLKPWSNVEKSNRDGLNDFVATMIGAVRDSDQPSKPFSRVLYGDLVYVGPSLGQQQYNFTRKNNNHYARIEEQRLPLKDVLVERRQSEVIQTEASITNNNFRDEATVMVNGNNGAAGVLTSRASGEAYFSMGTNRRVTRYLLLNFMCKDLEDIHDNSLPGTMVRRDVERTPGGDSRTFINKCLGCHAGQDGLGGAFAFYDFKDGKLEYTPGRVVEKFNHLPAYDRGFVTTNDSWVNYWGQFSTHNQALGFRKPFTGRGPASLGRAVANSRGFAVCMAKKSFKLMCIRPPVKDDEQFIESLADGFENNNEYNMKKMMAKAVSYCVEEKYAE